MENSILNKKNTSIVTARIIAFLLDSIIVYLMVTVLDKTILRSDLSNSLTGQIRDNINKGLFFSFYNIIVGNYIFKGQSIGKKLMKVKIVKENKEDIDLLTLLNREVLCRVFIERINLWILLVLSYTGVLQSLISGISSRNISPILWYIISLPWVMIISLMMMVNRADHLSLHDIIAKTKVISLK